MAAAYIRKLNFPRPWCLGCFGVLKLCKMHNMGADLETLTLTALHRAGFGETGSRVKHTRRVVLVTEHRKPLMQIVPPDMTVVPDEEYAEFEAWKRGRAAA